MKKRTRDYLIRKKTFIEMSHTPSVKSLLLAEFKSTRNLVVKKDIIKTIEEIEQMGKKVKSPAALPVSELAN